MGRVVIPGFRKIEISGGGEGGTSNYNDLTNKPSINNVPLTGNLRTVDLKLTDATLTEEGVPAEAKTVGAKLEEQSTSLTALSAQLGNHTVKSDVPENAVFTDTIYDDTKVKERLSNTEKCIATNLLNPTLQTNTQNGVTCTNNEDGTYTFTGTASQDTGFMLFDYKGAVFDFNRLRLVGFPFKNNIEKLGLAISNTTWDKVYSDKGDGVTFDCSNYNASNVYVSLPQGYKCNNLLIKPMITTNLDATYDDFVSYTGDTGQINSDVTSLLKRIETLESLVNKTTTITSKDEQYEEDDYRL